VLFDPALELELTRGLDGIALLLCLMVPSSCALFNLDLVCSGFEIRLEVNVVNRFVNFTSRVGSFCSKKEWFDPLPELVLRLLLASSD
jgi:hypothetical protein